MTTTPTTIRLKPTVLERLRFFARTQHRSMSEVIEEGINQVLMHYEYQRLDRIYDGLKQLDGRGDPEVTAASTTIDELLYGENGVWKGRHE